MNTRLTINLSAGLLEVEGTEEFVRSVYDDFKEQVSKSTAIKTLSTKPVEQIEQTMAEPDAPPVRAKKMARGLAAKPSKAKAAEYKPTFQNIDLAGLADFYSRFSPANHNEKILCFAIFLRDTLKLAPCSADDIYTCYATLKTKTKTPEAFAQAFITAKNRTHFIDFEWPLKIEVTIAGDNFSNEKLAKAGAPE